MNRYWHVCYVIFFYHFIFTFHILHVIMIRNWHVCYVTSFFFITFFHFISYMLSWFDIDMFAMLFFCNTLFTFHILHVIIIRYLYYILLFWNCLSDRVYTKGCHGPRGLNLLPAKRDPRRTKLIWWSYEITRETNMTDLDLNTRLINNFFDNIIWYKSIPTCLLLCYFFSLHFYIAYILRVMMNWYWHVFFVPFFSLHFYIAYILL